MTSLVGRRAVELPSRRVVGEVLVDVSDLAVRLGGNTIIHDVGLSVHAGEVVALVGPNGAGKSTVLAAICGDVPITGGSLVIDDRDASSWTGVELAMRRAVLPQSVAVSFPFTVREVVQMGRTPWARTAREDDDEAAVADALAATDAAHLADRLYTTLSGGERARAALARVLAQQTQLVLLDEPTAALDVRHQEVVMEQARLGADRGDGIVVVLHDLGLAAAHADTVVVMESGRVVASGPVAQVMTSELLSSVYGHHIDVFEHPQSGIPLVVPLRRRRRSTDLSPIAPAIPNNRSEL